MAPTCKFEFDQPKRIYWSGDVVKGRIVLTTTSELSCNEVYIEFNGRAKVQFSEKIGNTTTNYKSEVAYAHKRTTAFPKGKLPPGTHPFNFQVQIPYGAPSSCVGFYGDISYIISLVIDRPFRFDNKFEWQLPVLRPLDLNMLRPYYSIPLEVEDIKYFCCWPWPSGPVISNLELPFSGYAIGQPIKYKLHIDNRSKRNDVDGIKLKLKQKMAFTTLSKDHKMRNKTKTVAETTQKDKVLRLTKRVLEGELLIPVVPPTLIAGAKGIIDISYFVQVEIQTGVFHINSKIKIPLTIGTVPLAQSASNSQTVAPVDAEAPPPSYTASSLEQGTPATDATVEIDVDELNQYIKLILLRKYLQAMQDSAQPDAPPSMANSGDALDAPLLPTP